MVDILLFVKLFEYPVDHILFFKDVPADELLNIITNRNQFSLPETIKIVQKVDLITIFVKNNHFQCAPVPFT